MNISTKNQSLLRTLGYYALIILVGFVLEKIAPSGPCSPGIGFVWMIFIAPILTTGLLFRNFYLLTKGDNNHLYSFYFHLIIFISAIIVFVLAK